MKMCFRARTGGRCNTLRVHVQKRSRRVAYLTKQESSLLLRYSSQWILSEEAAYPGSMYMRPVFEEERPAYTNSGGRSVPFKVFAFRLEETEFRKAAAAAKDYFQWTSCQLIRNLIRSFVGMVEDSGARFPLKIACGTKKRPSD